MQSPKSKKSVSKSQPEREAKELVIGKILSIEEKKTDVDIIRAQNESRQLDLSEKSQNNAMVLAKLELETQNKYLDKEFNFKEKLLSKSFWLVIIFLFFFGGLIVFLSFQNKKLLKELLEQFYNLLKMIVGGTVGYFFGLRKKNKQDTED